MADTTIDKVNIELGVNTSNLTSAFEGVTSSVNKYREAIIGATNPTKEFVKEQKNLASSSNSASDALRKNTEEEKKVGQEADKSGKKIDNFADKFKKAFNVGGLFATGKTIFSKIMGNVNEASNYISTMNHFNIVMGEATQKANEFVQTYTDVLGLDPRNVMSAMASFKQMASGFGIASDAAYTMSKNLTQLSYDLSALGGQDVQSVMTGIQSAFSGQSRALRQYGVDISRASLQQTAYRLGIEQTVGSMTKAQRTELIYYQIMTRTANFHTLYGRTLLTPATALATLKNQFSQLARAIGNIFIPILMATLPYIRALTQLLMEAAQAIARFFGFELQNYSVSLSGVGGGIGALTDDVDDLGDAAGGTTKKLNKMLAPFDELNTIDFGDAGGGSGGSGIGGVGGGSLGIPLYDYDGLQGALTGANEKVEKIKENFKKILPFVEAIGIGILAWKISNKVLSFVDLLLGGKLAKNGGMAKIAFGLSLVVASTTLLINGIKKTIKEGATPESIGEIIMGALGLASGATIFLKGIRTIKLSTTIANNASQALESSGKIAKRAKSTSSFFSLPSYKTIIKGLGELALIISAIVGFVGVLGLLMKIPGFKQTIKEGVESLQITFNGLLSIAIPLTTVGVFLYAIDKVGVSNFTKGLAGFAIILAGVETIILLIGALMSIPYFGGFLSTGIQSTKDVFNGLYEIALPIGVLSGILIALGLVTPATILSGLVGLAIVIGGLEVVLLALGALNKIPGFTWLVNEGGEALISIGDILGRFAGSIVNGFANMMLQTFDDVGTHLSNFMNNAKPFFEGLSSIDESVSLGVKYIAEAILALTASSVLDGLTSWFTGGLDLSKFGQQLAIFAPYFKKYADTVSGIDTSVVKNSANAAKSLAELAKNLPNQGGVASWFAGDNTLDKWSSYLPKFGENLKKYSDKINGINSSVISDSANAAKSLAELAKNLPNQGGVASWFAGDNTLDKWSSYLPKFGENLKKYSDKINGMDASVINNSANAAKSLAELAKNLPNQGGVVSWFTGDNTLDKFGEKLYKFGINFKNYYNEIRGINISTIDAITEAIKRISDAYINIKNNGITQTIEDFAETLKNSAGAVKKFAQEALSNNDAWWLGHGWGQNIAWGINAGIKNTLNSTIKAVDSSTGVATKQYKIKAYAGGGYPTTGQLFMANEAGPELVGKIGNQTAVANNDQITSSLKQAAYEGISQALRENEQSNQTDIYIGNEKIYSGISSYINKRSNKYGTNVIRV